MTSSGTVAAAAAFAACVALIFRSSQRKLMDAPFTSYKATAKSIMLLAPLDSGLPSDKLGVHFDIKETEICIGGDGGKTLKKGEVLVKLLCLSADPYQRGRIKSENPLGGDGVKEQEATVMAGFVVGKVLASNDSGWSAGDVFGGSLPYTTIQVVNMGKAFVWKLNGVVTESTLSYGVGVLGMPGATAYGGLIDVLRPKNGEILWVSAASGAVGSLVGQIGKNVFGLKVIGSVGGPAKVEKILTKYGYDAAIDRKTLPSKSADGSWEDRKDELKRRLKEAAPDGLDMYFENVGEDHFDAAFESLKPYGRIAVCGQIAAYHDKEPSKVNIYPGKMIYTFQRIEGFVCLPWLTGKKGNFFKDMSGWIASGDVLVEETKFFNLESWPAAFRSLFENTASKDGKVVVVLQPEDYGVEEIKA